MRADEMEVARTVLDARIYSDTEEMAKAMMQGQSNRKSYIKRPLAVEAYQWFSISQYVDGSTRDVDSFSDPSPESAGHIFCKHCKILLNAHGWIDTLEGGHIVCPFDFIVTGIKGETYPVKPSIFLASYDVAEQKTREVSNDPLDAI